MNYKKELEYYKRQKQAMGGSGTSGQFYNTVVAMLEEIICLLKKRKR